MVEQHGIRGRDLFLIALGCALYALGLVSININNNLAEGGITGVTLILRFWFHLDPAYSSLLLNIPLIIVGYKFLDRNALILTVYGTVMLSLFLWLWQRLPVQLNLHHDLFIAGVMAGLCGGFGSGLIYRAGGTTGGSDVVARVIERQRGISMGRSLLFFDIIVLVLSLSYLDIRHMMYTLLASFIFSQVVDFTQEGAYAARGILIISDDYQVIADDIMAQLNRGTSFLQAEGGYQHAEKKVIYCVVAPNEIALIKRIIAQHDPQAFISIINVHEVLGEGFTYERKRRSIF
ncbi:YitT family protein [Loigolactobacillus zhaoyuanensis]|uniref:YitT family protein n=1 Tax=Loigolactobacillus zhaoyuanensis TaxID=2486017 RepID=UPI000F73AC32|nr:YitT family protein [Loigolactobacillus zhaoyuanensis]